MSESLSVFVLMVEGNKHPHPLGAFISKEEAQDWFATNWRPGWTRALITEHRLGEPLDPKKKPPICYMRPDKRAEETHKRLMQLDRMLAKERGSKV